MGKIVLLMGKSASGKDLVQQKLIKENKFNFKQIIMHTTRPKRSGEIDGREYFFCTENDMNRLEKDNKIIEKRKYDTVEGPWYYFTTNTNIDLKTNNYIAANTLVGFDKYLQFYSIDQLLSILIDVDDDIRLTRALEREKQQQNPNYDEMCRRFLADSKDFSYENIIRRPINSIIQNNGTQEELMDNVNKVLSKYLSK